MGKEFVKSVTPPILIDLAKWVRGILSQTPFYGVSGNFSTWQDALDYCSRHNHKIGYAADEIIDKVADAIQKVRNGHAEYERDSVLFYEKDYNYPFLSALFLAFNGIEGEHPIQVVDFGGSLGSTFFQNRSLFSTIGRHVVWNVIEQKSFVERGSKEVPEVSFYYTAKDFFEKVGGGNLLILSAVLDYLPTPNKQLDELLGYPWEYVLIDRSLYHPNDTEVIAVQTVPPSIYDAMYPLWIRSESKQTRLMKERGYDELLHWELPFSMPYQPTAGKIVRIRLRGFLYKKSNVDNKV